ncbi:MAG: gamma-glutamyltransferase [Halieaceae bacterium]|jgi:gamma-glutamyltranspeptidase/glutathione hydrolase|nr:gamma-glutamyltransferase [Halieaceae bacterium]
MLSYTPNETSPRLRGLLFLLLICCLPAARAGTAAVAMPDHYSAAVAQQVIDQGGNAVDAAVAAAFVLAVTYPEAGNIGGGGFMLSHMGGEAAFLDFRERAPLAASRDMYLDDAGNFLQHKALTGGLASGVPGTVGGLWEAHKRYGSLPWPQLIQPAVALASEGFLVDSALAAMAREKIAETAGQTNFAEYFAGLAERRTFAQPALARTLQRIAADPRDFYTGGIARQIVAQSQASGGIISARDLADYRAVWRTPLQYYWLGFQVLTAPPPSSGGVALLQLLGITDFAGASFRDIPHNSPTYIHLLAEIEKRVFADRAEYLGDADFVDVPLGQLLDPRYLLGRSQSLNPAAISGAADTLPGLESYQTTHFSILDPAGNAVALTYTLNWEFGSGVVVSGAGFLLNNEMDDFSARAGTPNKFGVVGSDRNAIAPGKRMLSSMTPTILLENGDAALVIGTPGGSTIFTSIFQVILNLYEHRMPLQQAVDATRFHHQLPDATLIRHDQRTVAAQTITGLRALGYTVEANSWGNLGDIQAIQRTATGIQAAADMRGRGVARVFDTAAPGLGKEKKSSVR